MGPHNTLKSEIFEFFSKSRQIMSFTYNYALFLQIGIISTFLYDFDMKKSKFLEKIGKNSKIWVIFAKTAIFHDPICDLGFLSSDTPLKTKNLKFSNFQFWRMENN